MTAISNLPPVPGEWRCSRCKPSALRNLGPKCIVCGCSRETSDAVADERERMQHAMRAAIQAAADAAGQPISVWARSVLLGVAR